MSPGIRSMHIPPTPGGTAIHHGVRRGRGPVAQGPAFQGGQPSAALSQHLQIWWAVLSHPSSPADSGNAKPVPQERTPI